MILQILVEELLILLLELSKLAEEDVVHLIKLFLYAELHVFQL